MTRSLAMALTLALTLMGATAVVLTAPVLVDDSAWARAGGGSSGGSRGSRSYSAPSRQGSPSTPSRPSAPSSDFSRSTTPQRGGWGSAIFGGLAGLAIGGLIGSMLFGNGFGGGGFGGGFGMIELLLVAGLAYLAFSFFRSRRAASQQPAVAGGYGFGSSGYGRPDAAPGGPMASTATMELPAGQTDLAAGIGHIRQMDPAFDPAAMTATASDVFFKVQAAWMARDMSAVRDHLTPEMVDRLGGQCAELRAQHRINRLENIAVRSTEVTEAWQEGGQDYVTVAFLASVLDYTTDEGGQVVEGSRTEPVRFEEYWTFARPVGPNRWKLSAIQQPS